MQTSNIISTIYKAFNERDIAAVLQYLHPGVQWPNGWEGGYVFGHHDVRNYWTRQWAEIDPVVTPVTVTDDGNTTNVLVHQLIKDKTGKVLFDGNVHHIYSFKEGLVIKMQIEE